MGTFLGRSGVAHKKMLVALKNTKF